MTHLVEFRRRIRDVGTITGFVVDFSDSLILLQRVTDGFCFDGYVVLRIEDISGYRSFSKPAYWKFQAVEHFGLKPKPPVGLSVTSLRELLESASQSFPLLTLHPEKTKPDVCYIGTLSSIAARTFTIEDLDSNCQWSGPRRLKFADITRVDLGDGYASALALFVPARADDPRT